MKIAFVDVENLCFRGKFKTEFLKNKEFDKIYLVSTNKGQYTDLYDNMEEILCDKNIKGSAEVCIIFLIAHKYCFENNEITIFSSNKEFIALHNFQEKYNFKLNNVNEKRLRQNDPISSIRKVTKIIFKNYQKTKETSFPKNKENFCNYFENSFNIRRDILEKFYDIIESIGLDYINFENFNEKVEEIKTYFK